MSAETARAISLLHAVMQPQPATTTPTRGQLEAKLEQLEAALAAAEREHRECLDNEHSHYWTRDRYGHYYPDYPARHAAFRRMERLDREIEHTTRMLSATPAPSGA
mgnify:FL=1